jgi:hypothetical protein
MIRRRAFAIAASALVALLAGGAPAPGEWTGSAAAGIAASPALAMPQQTIKNSDGTTTTIQPYWDGTEEVTRNDQQEITKIEFKDAGGKTTSLTYFTNITGGGKRIDRIHYYPGSSKAQDTTSTITAPDGSVTTEWVYLDLNENVTRRYKTRDETDANGQRRRYEFDYDTNRWHEVQIPSVLGANVPETSPSNSTAQPGYLVGIVASPGIRTTKVTTPSGTVAVNLPSDMAPGDNITGTVSAQPAGKTEQELARNLSELNGYVVQVGQQTTPVGQGTFTTQIASTLSAAAQMISVATPAHETVASATFPVSAQPPPQPTYFTLPAGGQVGKPVLISGPTSGVVKQGDSVTIGGMTAPVIVKWPRGEVVQNPSTTPGPTEIVMSENGQEIRATYQNTTVKLTSTQLHLRTGEQAKVTATVGGLNGTSKPGVVTVVNHSPEIVSMSGGDVQHRTFDPSEVGSDGTVSFQTTVTGRQPGAYNITAGLNFLGVSIVPAMNLAGEAAPAPPTPTAGKTTSGTTPTAPPPAKGETGVAGGAGSGAGAGAGGGPGGAPGGTAGGTTGGPAGGGPLIGKPPEQPPPPPISIGYPPPRHCKYKPLDGYFEPTQGVWQDDTDFVDKPGKRLVRIGNVDYRADLPMVAERDTVLAGVHHYVVASGGERLVNDRENIALSYETNCNTAVPVKFKFTVLGPGQAPIIFYGDQISLALIEDPRKDPGITATVKQWAYLGVPHDVTFKFQNPGFYKIIAELVKAEDGSSTGISMALAGEVIRTHGPVVNFVPAQLREKGYPNSLWYAAQRLAADSAKYIPDFYPLRPGGLPTRALGLRNFAGAGIGDSLKLIANLEDALTAGTFLNGAGRVVAILDSQDFETLQGTEKAGVTLAADFNLKKAGVVLNWKLSIVPLNTRVKVIAHELVHTLPGGWSSAGMLAECDRDYHNEYVYWANGLRLVGGGDPLRREKITSLPIMGPEGSPTLEAMEAPLGASSSTTVSVRDPETGKLDSKHVTEQWITQCTYWHLTKILPKPPDPAVLLVRGIVSERNGRFEGKFRSFYDLMGEADVQAGAAGEWSIVLRDAARKVLGEFPFTPHWNDAENTIHRDLVAFDFRVPALPGVMQADLKGPRGVLDSVKFSARAPEITISSPAPGSLVRPVNGHVHVRWIGSGEAGRRLLYTVLYSPGDDHAYGEQTFEQAGSSWDVELTPGVKTHFVKVIVTDGTRSAERVAKFTTP